MLFLCRELFRHNILPKAVRYYTGEIVGEEDEYDDEDEDDDEDDEVSIAHSLVHVVPQILLSAGVLVLYAGRDGCASSLNRRSHQWLSVPQ